MMSCARRSLIVVPSMLLLILIACTAAATVATEAAVSSSSQQQQFSNTHLLAAAGSSASAGKSPYALLAKLRSDPYYKDEDFVILEQRPSASWLWLSRPRRGADTTNNDDGDSAGSMFHSLRSSRNDAAVPTTSTALAAAAAAAAAAKISRGFCRSVASLPATSRFVAVVGVAAFLRLAFTRWMEQQQQQQQQQRSAHTMAQRKEQQPGINSTATAATTTTPDDDSTDVVVMVQRAAAVDNVVVQDEESFEQADWKGRYELAVAQQAVLEQQLQAAQLQFASSQAECTKRSETAFYWENVARNQQAALQAAAEFERAHGTDEMERLKKAMVATVDQERAKLLAEFQDQVAMLRTSLLQA